MSDSYQAALAYLAAGWTPHPLRGKVPQVREWSQLRNLSQADCYAWWGEDPSLDIGIVCGEASGNLLVVDIEGRLASDSQRMARVLDAAAANGALPYLETAIRHAGATTPSGGRHLFFQLTDGPAPPNAKLAFGDVFDPTVGRTVPMLLAETRGEGGQVAAWPGEGRDWLGDSVPGSALPVTGAQLDLVLDAFRSIDEHERIPALPAKPRVPDSPFSRPEQLTVAAALAEALLAGEMSWLDVLDPGWTFTGFDRQGRSMWLRPPYAQPSDAMYSAIGFERYEGGPAAALVVHSSSVPHLPIGAGQRLTPARVLAYCHFGGDERVTYAALEAGEVALPAPALARVAAIVAEQRAPAVQPTPPTAVVTGPFVAPVTELSPLVRQSTSKAAPMPRGLLGPIIEDAIDTVSAHNQAPCEVAAFIALATLSAATAGGIEVDVAGTGWTEPLALYCMAVARPSERKSSVKDDIGTRPLANAMGAFNRAHERQRIDGLTKVRELETKLKDFGKQLEAGQPVHMEYSTTKMLLDAAQKDVIEEARFLVSSSTVEALESLMAQQHGAAAVLASEGNMVQIITGLYSDKIDITLFNSAWSHEYIHTLRVKRGDIRIDRPHIAIGLAVQPAVLDRFSAEEMSNTGFVARWLICQPESLVGKRTSIVPPVDRVAIDRWESVLTGVMGRGFHGGPAVMLRLTPDADAFRRVIQDATEAELLEAAGGIEAWLGKSVGHTIRIAGLIALAENPEAIEVSLDHLQRAHAWFTWAKAETVRLIGTGLEYGDSTLGLRRVADWLRNKKQVGDQFTQREVHQSVRQQGWAKHAEAVGEVLEELVDLGYLAVLPTPPQIGPGRPKVRLQVVSIPEKGTP